MKGYYKIYKNNKLVSESDNLITNFGKKYILKYLSDQVPYPFDTIAIGASSVTPTVNDLSLGLEFARSEVILKSVKLNSGLIMVKAAFSDTTPGIINEIGTFPGFANPNTSVANTELLATFDSSIEAWTAGTMNTTVYRVGTSSLQFTVNASTASTADTTIDDNDLGHYSTKDKFALGYFLNDGNCASITVNFKTDATNYYSAVLVPTGSSGYFITNFGKSNCTKVGNADWSNITIIEVIVTAKSTGTTVVQLDGLSVIDLDTYQNYGLVSRSIPPTPQPYLAGEEINVEYYVVFTI